MGQHKYETFWFQVIKPSELSDRGMMGSLWLIWTLFCSDVTHHSELGLGLLYQIILLRLADAGEDARLRVEV